MPLMWRVRSLVNSHRNHPTVSETTGDKDNFHFFPSVYNYSVSETNNLTLVRKTVCKRQAFKKHQLLGKQAAGTQKHFWCY